MEMFRIKIKEGNNYLKSTCMQTTKDKGLSLMTREFLDSRLELFDNSEINIEKVNVEVKPCKIGDLGFNPDDTYYLTSANAVILYETKKSLYAAKIDDDGNIISSSIQKYSKVKDLNKIHFATGKGIKLGE